MVDLKMLDALAKVCQKHGISHLKYEGLEVSLNLISAKPKAKEEKKSELIEFKMPERYAELTDDELLFGGAQ